MKPSNTIRPEHVGQDFDEFLASDGIAAEVEARAIDKLFAALQSSTKLDPGGGGAGATAGRLERH